ncbi:MAG: T9SS type A sorting domain-containing protein [Saprospiraceae bacterium]|nr:T9SS type A sorting domain-containing protein [Saprospiraceae bacterium]
MKKYPALLLVSLPFTLLSILSARAQTMETEVIGAAGSSVSTTAATLQWTVGEPMIRTTGQTAILSEGFHQTAIWEIVPVEEVPEIDIAIRPNPFSAYVEIRTAQPVLAVLHDLSGKLIVGEIQVTQNATLTTTHLSAGTYILSVSTPDRKHISTYKLVHIP